MKKKRRMGVNGFTFDFKGLDDLDFFAIGVRGKGDIMRIEKAPVKSVFSGRLTVMLLDRLSS